ncbi:MAG TPA: GNAT family N-acetyltransferase [Tepidisphaeraceae bacterium]|jgi:GNAT superfamily N-acetyltransferase|nr:GNAT family N-acetyltransferase [Tepidisphaeraceae bacterium]
MTPRETEGGPPGAAIRRATLEEIIDLRHAVLRRGLPRHTAIFPGDELATSRHYAATLPGTGQVIGCATLHLNQWESHPAWQLRGMATADDFRGKGIGRSLLQGIEQEIRNDDSSPHRLWCNARVPAAGFYQALGWRIVSEPFDIPTAGPHVRMTREVGREGG